MENSIKAVQARETAAWTFQHLADVSNDPSTATRVILDAERAFKASLDVLADVRAAEDAMPYYRAAWRRAERRSRMAAGVIDAARRDAEDIAFATTVLRSL